jgi:hypothetical protein
MKQKTHDIKNPVRADAACIMKNARSVRINHANIELLADRWAKEKVKSPAWSDAFHLQSSDPRRLLTYVILLDSLNFCFWSRREKWHITESGKKYSGYLALATALKVWFLKYPDRSTFAYFAAISWREFKTMLRGGEHILFLRKRWQIFRAVSGIFMKNYRGDPVPFVRAAGGRFSRLVPKIVRELPSFNDTAVFRGRKVSFLKRAQILAGDIWGVFHGKRVGRFTDLEYLTAFADYKLPQYLYFCGIFKYAPSLEKKILKKMTIPAGSLEEMELRAATICAVEEFRGALLRRGVDLYPFEIDWLLWNASKREKLPVPHHLTKTIFY